MNQPSIEFMYPETLSPQELDLKLSEGWFRMRDALFTTHYYLRDGQLLSTVWLRMATSARLSKGMRRLLRLNDARFEVTVEPLVCSTEQEELYTKYLTVARGERSEDISDVIGGSKGLELFDNWMVEVRIPEGRPNAGKLIALSIFDCGAFSMQSILAIYDPEYSEFSLGIYTMAKEVEFAKSSGKEFYYIGYFTPTFSGFDYKLRLPELQYYDAEIAQWKPLAELDRSQLWSSKQIESLGELKLILEERGIDSAISLNLHYDVVEVNKLGGDYLDMPVFLNIFPENESSMYLVAHYDIRTNLYHVHISRLLNSHCRYSVGEPGPYAVCTKLVRLKFWIASSISPGVLMDECSFIFKNIREESQQSELQEQTAVGLLQNHHKERSFFDWEE